MLNECSESYRNGQELSNVCIRTSVTTFLISSPACSLLRQLSQLLLFSDSFQQRAFYVVLLCLFLCAAATTIWGPHSFVNYATENFLVRRKSPQQRCKRKQKNSEDWQQKGKRTQKSCEDLCTLVNARHGRCAYNEDDDSVVSYSLDKEIMENWKWR